MNHINYIAGGMLRNQQVSNKTFKISYFRASTVKENNESFFKLYPNPTSQNINLQFETTAPKTITLIDVLGKEVLKINSSNKAVQLDVTNYPKGVYFVKVSSEEGNSVQKIIIE